MDRVLPKHSSLELFLSGLVGLVNPKLRRSSSGEESDSSDSSEIDLSLATAALKSLHDAICSYRISLFDAFDQTKTPSDILQQLADSFDDVEIATLAHHYSELQCYIPTAGGSFHLTTSALQDA